MQGCTLPFADEIAGRIYLNYLCATEAGVTVYHTVELPAEYWDGQGKPNFFNRYGNLDRNLWIGALNESSQVLTYSSIFFVDEDRTLVKRRTNNEILAEVTTYRYWGDWVRRNLSPHNTADSCDFINDSGFSRSFYGQIFRPAR